jgi:hypothetical protein
VLNIDLCRFSHFNLFVVLVCSFNFFFFFFFLDTGSYHTAQAGLELIASSFPSAGIIGTYHHA